MKNKHLKNGIKISFVYDLKKFTSLVMIVSFALLVLLIILKRFANVDEFAVDCVVIVLQIAISVAGTSLFLEATSFRKVVKEEIESLLTGESQSKFMLQSLDSKSIFNILHKSFLKESNKDILLSDKTLMRDELQSIIKNVLLSTYIVEDKRKTVITIKDDKIIKTVERTQTFKSYYREYEPLRLFVECVNGTAVKTESVALNGKKLGLCFECTQQRGQSVNSSYTDIFELTIPLENLDQNKVEIKMSCEIPIDDKSSYFLNTYPCAKLEHTLVVKAEKPIDVEVILFALNKDINKNATIGSYYIEDIGKENDGSKANTIIKKIHFNNWSFPGDGYGFNIRI